MNRHILFSGCACTGTGKSVRAAAITLAGDLDIELREAPITACCGARTAGGATAPDARHLLAPLLSLDQGLDIVCLSPACRDALAAHLAALAGNGHAAGAGMQSHLPNVRDFQELLSGAYAHNGENRLQALPKRLSFLRVALHRTCHADHDVAQRLATAQTGTTAPQASTGSQPPVPHSRVAPATALADLVAASGATVLDDVSGPGTCAQFSFALNAGDTQEAARCLTLAAEAGADVLLTPCVRCFIDLRRNQETLSRGDRARSVAILHLVQLLERDCSSQPITWIYGAQRP